MFNARSLSTAHIAPMTRLAILAPLLLTLLAACGNSSGGGPAY
ncbi:MAG TPA: hypothetical protein VGQ31_10085 [Candidatus Limnocylindrales bacterium]|nr:hypothetical protein [Candidatus Limnocylindrales bacterium]